MKQITKMLLYTLYFTSTSWSTEEKSEVGTKEKQNTKPARLEPVLRDKRSHRNEKPARRNEE